MRLVTRVRYFVAGILLTNSLPHVAIGLTGRRNMTPFGRNSSAFVDMVWGAADVVGGATLLRRTSPEVDASADANGWLIALEAGSVCWSVFMVLYEVAKRTRQNQHQ